MINFDLLINFFIVFFIYDNLEIGIKPRLQRNVKRRGIWTELEFMLI